MFAYYVPAIHVPKETVLMASEQVNIIHNFEGNRLREDLLAHVLFSGLNTDCMGVLYKQMNLNDLN